MLNPTLTHYAPWDESDELARCGYRMTDRDTHSAQPTCPHCAATIAAEETALEAAIAGDNPAQPSPVAAELFDWAVDLVRAAYVPPPPAPARYQRLAAELLSGVQAWAADGADETFLCTYIADYLEQEFPEAVAS